MRILLSNKSYPKSKQKLGNNAKIYSKNFPTFRILSSPLNIRTKTEPSAPTKKFNKIIPF